MGQDTLYFLFSKYSESSQKLFTYVRDLATHIHILPVQIDDPETRSKVVKTAIKTVPCIIAQTADEVKIYEGQNLLELLKNLANMVQNNQVQAAPQEDQGLTSLESVPVQSIAPPPNTIPQDSFTASVNARLTPQQFNSPPPAQPMLTNQIQQGVSTQQIAQQYANTAQAQTPLPQQQMQQMPPQDMMQDQSQMFDNSNAYTQQDITGGQIRSGGGKGGAKQLSESMLREREQSERSMFPNQQMMR